MNNNINKSLFALSNEYADLYNALLASVDEDGVVDDNAFMAVEQAKGELRTKLSNTANVYQAICADIARFDERIEQLTAMRDRLVKSRDRVIGYIDNACRTAGIVEIQGDFVNIKYKNNPPHVEIADESDIPDEYRKTVVKTTMSIDKAKIKVDIQSGKEVAGAYLKQDMRIEIK